MVSTVRELNRRGVVRAPRHAVVATSPIPAWRWFALCAIVLAVFHDRATHDAAITWMLSRHGAALLPGEAILGIGSVALVGLLGYALFQLVADQRRVEIHDRVSRHVVTYGLLSVLATTTLRHDSIHLTAAILAASAMIAGAAYVRVQTAITAGHAARWIGIPFALAFGVAALFCVAAVDAAAGSHAVAIAACATVAVIALQSCLRFHDILLPSLIGWGLVASCAANHASAALAGGAFLGGSACAALAIVVAFTRWSTPPPVKSRRR